MVRDEFLVGRGSGRTTPRDGHLHHVATAIIAIVGRDLDLGQLADVANLDAHTALQAKPQIPEEIAAGKFNTLHTWLKDEIYQHGRKFTAPELIERVTGGPMRIEPYIRYLWEKYGDLYALPVNNAPQANSEHE